MGSDSVEMKATVIMFLLVAVPVKEDSIAMRSQISQANTAGQNKQTSWTKVH